MRSARILVTGGAGMIGSNLVRRLVSMGNRVLVVDNLWRGRLEYLQDESGRHLIDLDEDFYEFDLAVPGVLDPLLTDIDYVFHLADVVAGIGYVFDNQLTIFRQNVLINSNVTKSISRTSWLQGYIYVGTACSFPAHLQTGLDAAPLREEDQYPAAPESAYGWSKLMGEYEASLMEREFGVPVALPVLHNVYGAPCDFDEGRSQVIPALIRKAIEYPQHPFVVWGSGQQGRAFVHVDDAVDGLISSMQHGLGKGAIQLGPDHCTSVAELADLVVQTSGKEIDIEYDRSRPEGDKGRCANFSKAKRELGWAPAVTLKEGVTKLYRWIEARMQSTASAT